MKRKQLLLIASFWFSLPAARAEPVCPPVTRVGLSDLGYTSYREQGRIGGIAVDIANEMARRTGCKFEFHWYPRQRLFIELAAGHVDMTMGSLRLPERDAYANYLPYEMGRAEGTLASPPIYSKYLKQIHLPTPAVIVPLPESAPQFTGIYLSKQTVSPAVRRHYAAALKAMTEEQRVRAIYAKYFDEATVRRLFRPGPATLVTALSAAE